MPTIYTLFLSFPNKKRSYVFVICSLSECVDDVYQKKRNVFIFQGSCELHRGRSEKANKVRIRYKITNAF